MSPNFGHQVLQHSNGRQSRILATSLGPAHAGVLYQCDLQDEIHCEKASLGENIKKLKKLQPGIAVAQNPEQILTCLQQKRRQQRRITQELNGLCILLTNDLQEKAFINLTDIIETKLNKNMPMRRRRSNNMINNVGLVDVTSSTCQNPESAHRCKEKDSTGEFSEFGYQILNANNNNNYILEEEEEEDELDLRTEIAIVLDGSGSIEPEDFEQAKDFIYNVMKMFYEKCFECIFALVQYGTGIQTEFDLRDGRNTSVALKKLQAVRQVGGETWTASAIQHVRDSIFNENYGSQRSATKFIIVLTDGEIFLDPLKLDTVINSEKLVGIDRYAIGVGSAFSRAKALQELSLIASDPDESHLFRVTNYSALNVLLSALQQKIIGLEGTAGDILEFELAQSGFSVHFLDNDNILFGAVGAFDWSGGILQYNIANKTAYFLNESIEAPGVKNSYLGYSVSTVNTEYGTLIVAGAPRHCMTGKVMVFEEGLLKQTLSGEQIGSYFGSELCPLDIDQDGLTDYLLVGAPFFHIHGEEGKVYIYRLDKDRENPFALIGHLSVQPASAFARFGFSIGSIGDIDQDGYGDVAIGAPLEDHQANPGSFGSVYIYNSKKDGVWDSRFQRITAAQIGPGLVYFGRSVAGGLDLTTDGLPDIIVGSLGNLTVLRSRLVVRLNPTVQFTPGEIFNFHNSSIITARVCFNRSYPLEMTRPEMQNLFIRYTVDLDVKMEKKRVQFEDHTTTATWEVSYTDPLCPEFQLYILPCKDNCFSSIFLKVSYQLHKPDEGPSHPVPMLDIYKPSEVYSQLPYKDDCNKTICAPHLSLAIQTQKELIVGYTKFLTLNIHLANSGDNSYMTTMVLEYPSNLLLKNVQELSTLTIDCDAPIPTTLLFSSMRCKIGHPAFKTTTANFSVTWQVDEKKFLDNLALITATVTNANNSTAVTEKCIVNVKYALATVLSRRSQVLYVTVEEGTSESLQFEFNINGKNQYGAKLQLLIEVPAFINDLLVAEVQSATGTQNTTECTIEKDFGLSSGAGIKHQLVNCTILVEREEVIVTAELLVADSLQNLKDPTDLLVTGKITFDRNLYVGLNEESHQAEILVTLLKVKNFSLFLVVTGSCVGGLLLLAIITVILYKCGFFKRKYKNRIEENHDS